MYPSRPYHPLIVAFVWMLACAGVLSQTACSVMESDKAKAKREQEEEAEATAEELYEKARGLFDEGNYKKAAKSFDDVERLHPYSEWSARAQILSGYASYKAEQYDDAILTFERFTKLHPGHESAAYAFYMIALCNYEQISDVGRDQGLTEKAQESLRNIVQRYPDTEFARDAKLKLDLTEDHLAGKEMMVGRYYLERDEYLAAVNRFRNVVINFQTTSHVPEALHRLVETYLKLGVEDEARRYAAVLGHNFPSSQWYKRSYALLEANGVAPPDVKKGFFQNLLE
ncbi:MAG: outer membrane protein assembly factor BamD [Rickettsiales bacterium]|nr:outer membrane protein assembly factor BamD [Rickettsiales bacterium]